MFQIDARIGGKDRAVAFSGHRRIVPPSQLRLFGGRAAKEDHEDMIRSALEGTLRILIKDGYRTFLCGMAAGFDLMAGQAICKLIDAGEDISLVAAVPHSGQSDRFPAGDKAVYHRILHYTSHIYTVCEEYRPDCFHRRNDFLIQNASVLVCFYDGSPGGTQYTVKRALRCGLRVINLY